MIRDKNFKLFGVTTIGERGQVVVPGEARQEMDIKKGDKFIVFGSDGGMVTFVPLETIRNLTSRLDTKVAGLKEAILKISEETNDKK